MVAIIILNLLNTRTSLDELIIYLVYCHLCSDFFTFLYFGISFSSHPLHHFLTLFLDILDLSFSILKFSFLPFNKLSKEIQYTCITEYYLCNAHIQ